MIQTLLYVRILSLSRFVEETYFDVGKIWLAVKL
jgi:hypothetical protein